MDKKVIKNFAIESRKILIAGVTNKLSKLGITKDGIDPINKIDRELIEYQGNRFSGKNMQKNYDKLVEELAKREIQTGSHQIAFENLVEEVAYTWFNRIIAIRFMEVNDYLPEGLRVLASETTGKKEPDIITHLLETTLYAEMDSATRERAERLLMDGSADAVDELYQLVFIKQCNSLNQQLPDLFEKIDDYTELLFTVSYIDENGVIAKLLTIPEADFDVEREGQVEIIGWMYQYYNTEPKDKVFARGNRKIRADEIPAATQLFTPDWIVRYMVENSLGRYYIDQKLANPLETRTEKEIADEFGWKYYLPTAEQPEDVQLQIQAERKEKSDFALQELKLLDNAMGSGHILVYAFDVLLELYRAEGYTDREAAELIISKNLYGLEIDKRAYQLAYFAIMMKGRQYSRRILSKDIRLNLHQFINMDQLSNDYLERLMEQSDLSKEDFEKQAEHLNHLVSSFHRGEEIGAILRLDGFQLSDIEQLSNLVNEYSSFSNMDILYGLPEIHENIKHILAIAKILLQKYAAVVTNPPYLNKMSTLLGKYVVDNYKDVKTDLFSVFIKMNSNMLVNGGYAGFMTPFVWMFIKSYEELRTFLINNKSISSLIQMEYSAFEEATVPVCSFVIKNNKTEIVGNYFKLSDFRGGMQVQKEKVLEGIMNPTVDYFYQTDQQNFTKIPGSPISFWVSENVARIFMENKAISQIGETRRGLQTGDSIKFIRYWFEPSSEKISFEEKFYRNYKWYFLNSGGNYRKWYVNIENVVNWENNGDSIKKTGKSIIPSENKYFSEVISWNKISSGKFSVRLQPGGIIPGDASPFLYVTNQEILFYLLGLLNSKISNVANEVLSPTLNFEVGNISKIPVAFSNLNTQLILEKVKQNILLSKLDLESVETSPKFKRNTLIATIE